MASAARKLVAIVIDGLTPAALERAVERRTAPALKHLVEHGDYGYATSVFPSLTPVCMSSIATGAYPDVHRIPHLVWYHRAEQRLVEYGSSFGAIMAAGTRRSILDTILYMNERHLSPAAVTVYEALDDAGLTTAAVNVTCYRGRTPHRATIPIPRSALGPRRFFYYNLFESDVTGAPLSVRRRSAGTVDGYAAAVGRWLVTRDGFDFLFYYLSDYDYFSHVTGPEAADDALARADEAVGALLDAAGGPDEFLQRYAVVLFADHGQTPVTTPIRLEDAFAGLELLRRGGAGEIAVAASNRAAQVYRLGSCRRSVRELAERLDGYPGVEVALFLEDGEAVARRDGSEVRFDGSGALAGDPAVLDHPDAFVRAWTALRNPNAGELLVSGAPGYEFADLGGKHHAGGGSHGSLCAGDSIVPMLTIGVERRPRSIVDVAPTILEHFGVEPPAYASRLADAA